MRLRIALAICIIAIIIGAILLASCGHKKGKANAEEKQDLPQQFFYLKDTVLTEHSPDKRLWLFASDSLFQNWIDEINAVGIHLALDPVPIWGSEGDFFWLRSCRHNDDCKKFYLEPYKPLLESIGSSLGIKPYFEKWGRIDDIGLVENYVFPHLTASNYQVISKSSLAFGSVAKIDFLLIKVPRIKESIGIIFCESVAEIAIIDTFFYQCVPLNIGGVEYNVLRNNAGSEKRESQLYLIIKSTS